jgi:archaemetzincin
MKVGIVRIEEVNEDLVNRVQENLTISLPQTTATQIAKVLPLPKQAYDEEREQYRSNTILNIIRTEAEKNKSFDAILGIIDVDIFASPLSFVFGQAENPGKAALISLWRLNPEFYGKKANMELFVERSTKEAVHEIGHTLGLQHCSNPFCVMYFSNSIFETDRKQSLFCNKCYLKIEKQQAKKDEDVEQPS